MAITITRMIMNYFGMNAAEFKREWTALSPEDKAWFRAEFAKVSK